MEAEKFSVRAQVRTVIPWVVLTFVVVVLSGIAILLVHYLTDINVLVLTVDPAAEVGLAPYVGVFSYIGILAMWSGATVAVFTALLPGRYEMRPFLLSLGLIMALLALDDLFLIHEEIGRELAIAVGSPEDRSLWEAPVFLMYGIIVLAWLWQFRTRILRTPWLLLLGGLVALGISVTIDIGEFVFPDLAEATPWMGTTIAMVEDLAKLGGLFLFMAYTVVIGRHVIGARPSGNMHDQADGAPSRAEAPVRTAGRASRIERSDED